MFLMGYLHRGSTAKAEVHYRELPLLGALPLLHGLGATTAVSYQVCVIKACSSDLREKYTLRQWDQRQSNAHHLMLLEQLDWQSADVFAEHIIFIYWFVAMLSNLLPHGCILRSSKFWASLTYAEGQSRENNQVPKRQINSPSLFLPC